MIKSFIVFFLALAFGLTIASPIITKLKRMKFGQNVSKKGPKEHLKKQGLPTMGGFIFVIPLVVISTIFLIRQNQIQLAIMLCGTLLFGFIGFIDDYLKIVKKDPVGLKPYMKIILNIVFGILIGWLLYNNGYQQIHIPIINKVFTLSLPIYIAFIIVFYTSVTNSVNLSDGVDGLCGSITSAVTIFFAVFALTKTLPYEGGEAIAIFASAATGAILAYLFFNWHPARVMMGDTGSFSLGGLLATLSILTGTEILFILIGLVYVIEALSDIIQLTSKKLRNGKRVFLMAPIHHHYEKKGWSEQKIVLVFFTFTAICCIAAWFIG